jgi:alpha-tubulin suppressor-like RCC1 family protein
MGTGGGAPSPQERPPGILRRTFLKVVLSVAYGSGFLWSRIARAAGYYNIGAFLQASGSGSGSPGAGPDPGFDYGMGPGGGFTSASTGKLYMWGAGLSSSSALGQIGDGASVNRSSPVLIGTATTWAQVHPGGGHTLGLNSAGGLFGWGLNSFGQLGDNSRTNRAAPGAQIGAQVWKEIAAGERMSLGITSDGQLWSWGANTYGALGKNDATIRSIPTNVSTTLWKRVFSTGASASGVQNAFAILTDGSLYAWGCNSFGNLGLGDTAHRSVPTLVSSSQWAKVSPGDKHTVALNSKGQLWVWGCNSFGALGLGTVTTLVNRPTYGSLSTLWKEAFASQDSSIGLTTLGAALVWGKNTNSQLGLNSTAHQSTPTLLSTSIWKSLGAGNTNMGGVLTTGQLYMWGTGGSGALGTGTATNASVPTQVGSHTYWIRVTVGGNIDSAGFTYT